MKGDRVYAEWKNGLGRAEVPRDFAGSVVRAMGDGGGTGQAANRVAALLACVGWIKLIAIVIVLAT